MAEVTLQDRYYPRTFEEKADPSHTALIVVDMQNDFCAPEGYVARQGWNTQPLRDMSTRLRHFIAAARPSVPVIHVRGQYEPAVMPPQMVERLIRLGIGPYCQPGTAGVEFLPGFEPEPGDIVITKRTFSAFAHTELEHVLRNMGIKTVIITGTFTNVCIDSTARDAYFRGFYVIVPEDLCACPDPEIHAMTLATLGHFFGVVVPSQRLLETWSLEFERRAS